MPGMSVGSFFDKLAGANTSKSAAATPQVTAPKRPGHTIQIPYPSLSITKVAVLAFIIGASFFMGAAYEKTQQTSTQNLSNNGTSGSTNSTNQPTQSGSFGGGFGQMYRRQMTPEQVTAISSSSITVKDSSGTTTNYTIDSNTLIEDNGQQVDYTDISTGDTVIVLPSRTDTSTARRIIVNPNTTGSTSQPTTLDPGTTQTN